MKLKELSDILGLSQTTVSRALNGYPEVSANTRDRVLRAAARYHYKPNHRASGLATGRAMAIGHVMPLYSQHELVNPIFAEFISGASQTYHKHGYELVLSFVDGNNEQEAYRSMIAKGTVDGIVLHMPSPDDSRVALLNSMDLPFVIHGRASACEEPYSWIDVNNEAAFSQATKLLLDLGHRRIGLINGLGNFEFAIKRELGYSSMLERHGLQSDPQLIKSASMTETHGYQSTLELLGLVEPPTAILASSYVVGLGVNRALSEFNLRMGTDVSVIIHDDELSYFNNSGDLPLFTATRSSVREAGVRAAEMLLELIQDPSRTPRTCLLEAPLTIGQSTGPVRAAANDLANVNP